MSVPLHLSHRRSIQILRIVITLFMMAHGITRLSINGPVHFGEFLTSKGFPMGEMVAWGITFFEIIGGIFLILGYQQRLISVLYILELFMGIVLVHFKNGWFVVGLTSGGIEYSVLLIICFLLVFLTAENKAKPKS